MASKQALRVIGYARVSTEEQATDGVSLDAQAEKIRGYSGLYGLDLVDLVSGPESAKTLDRPGLKRVLAALDSGEAGGVVVAKLDRLTRSVAGLAELLRDYFGADAGFELFSVADSIDTRTAAGRLVLNVLMSVSQWERETIVERTREALGHMRRSGECTGTVPYGWDLDPHGPRNAKGRPTRLVANGAESAVIDRIRRLAAEGHGPRPIAKALDLLGVPTRTGGPWYPRSIRRILARFPTPSTTPGDAP
jgi:site-specific DNA recombinase